MTAWSDRNGSEGWRPLIPTLIAPGASALEIGALDRPILTKGRHRVEYVDRASREDLAAWYRADPGVDTHALVDVDHVWGEQDLTTCVGGRRRHVVASHVIEHVPDVFGWLREVADVLEDGGELILVVPDKRMTFDVQRPLSTSGEFVDAYRRRLRRPDIRQVFNHVHDTVDLATGPVRAEQRAEGGWALLDQVEAGEYIDVHCWVLTPRSFAEALDLASRLSLLPFEIARIEETPEGAIDFLVVLRRLERALSGSEMRARFVASFSSSYSVAGGDEEDATLLAAQGRLALAKAAVMVAKASAIENSTIWRATAPLRKLLGVLRRR